MCRFAISLRPIASRKALTAMSTAPETSKPIAANLVWSVLTVLAACVVALAFRTRNCFVDDAFIDFQYLENLWAGKGFVFHPGTVPVEGVTNIGWLLVLAPLSSVADPAAVAKLLGLALVLSTLILTASLGRYLAANVEPAEESLGLVLVPLLVLAASFDFVYFSLAGMETALLAAILMLGACLVPSGRIRPCCRPSERLPFWSIPRPWWSIRSTGCSAGRGRKRTVESLWSGL